MNLHFTNDYGWSMEVDLGAFPTGSPWEYWLSTSPPGMSERFVAALSRQLPWLVLESLDPDFRRPSDRRLRYAIDIAIALGISFPRDALIFDSAAAEFIDAHSERLALLRQKKNPDMDGGENP